MKPRNRLVTLVLGAWLAAWAGCGKSSDVPGGGSAGSAIGDAFSGNEAEVPSNNGSADSSSNADVTPGPIDTSPEAAGPNADASGDATMVDPCADDTVAAPANPPNFTQNDPTPISCAGTAASTGPASLLATFASQYSDRASWETRAKIVREGIQKKMRLFPWPTKTPLNAVIHSRKVDTALGIAIENVYFESVPGFFVTGNLYRPLKCSGKIPGILKVHGHWDFPARFAPDYQAHAAAMASMGAFVFLYDMVGKTESTQIAHCFPEGVIAAQTWDTIRAVDFLLSLGADPERIGITGESGGGTQSYLATALDPRITLSMPAVIVGGPDVAGQQIWMGGCNCEATGMGINKDADPNNAITDYETDSVDIAALAAPRFQLILSDSNDNLARNAPITAMPYLKTVYGFYGAQANLANFVDNTGHNYHANKRLRSYQFLAEKFKMGPLPDESKYVARSAGELKSFTPDHPRPPNALKTKAEIMAALLR